MRQWARLTAIIFATDVALGLAVRGIITAGAAAVEVASRPQPRILDGRLLAVREDYGDLTRAAEEHLAECSWARADETSTGLPFAVSEARRRLRVET